MLLRIDGPAAEEWAERLQQQFREQFGMALDLQRQEQQTAIGSEDHRVDVLGTALGVGSQVVATLGLVAALPEAVLSWTSQPEREALAQKLQPILKVATAAAVDGQQVSVVVEGLPAQPLDQLNAQEWLALGRNALPGEP